MLTEAEVEGVLLDQLAGLGYACLSDTVSGPDGAVPEREAYSDTILARRLRAAVARLNPAIPEEAREDAVRRVIASDRPSLIEENRRLHRAMVEGVPVEYRAADGTIRGDAVRLVDPDDRLNDWLALSQFTVTEAGHNRRPDVVVFLNGLPVAVIEPRRVCRRLIDLSYAAMASVSRAA
ncbi:type I restriction endonuclease [Gemmobacter caeruleus]|uniref:type I restriction endonuclease n=1 Tax=Gemmobacter caeruleus TaxID=2595004 RepID=UPI0011EDFFA5|nr:type I restriction endonuclease [Gemmobacter caeruleus]